MGAVFLPVRPRFSPTIATDKLRLRITRAGHNPEAEHVGDDRTGKK